MPLFSHLQKTGFLMKELICKLAGFFYHNAVILNNENIVVCDIFRSYPITRHNAWQS